MNKHFKSHLKSTEKKKLILKFKLKNLLLKIV